MGASESKIWVLLKESSDHTSVHAAYSDRAELDARVERIGQANKQYPLERLSADAWRIGPDEDEGFFGNKPIHLRAVEVELK